MLRLCVCQQGPPHRFFYMLRLSLNREALTSRCTFASHFAAQTAKLMLEGASTFRIICALGHGHVLLLGSALESFVHRVARVLGAPCELPGVSCDPSCDNLNFVVHIQYGSVQ
jgi:hypothetical protein